MINKIVTPLLTRKLDESSNANRQDSESFDSTANHVLTIKLLIERKC